MTKTKGYRGGKSLSFPSPWEFQTPISFLRNRPFSPPQGHWTSYQLARNWLSHYLFTETMIQLMAIIWKRNSASYSLKEHLWRSLSIKANIGQVCTICNLATWGNGDDIIKGCSLWWLFIWSCKLVNEKEREKVGGDRERQVGEGDSVTINLIVNDTLLSAAATVTRGYLKRQIHCPDQSSHCLSF